MDEASRLERLESKLAFQEDHIQQLNDIITQLQLEVMTLNERVVASEQRLREITPSLLKPLAEEAPPPHY